jgi:hypothetical protein
MLDAIPDLSETLATAIPQQLAEIFKAFAVTIPTTRPTSASTSAPRSHPNYCHKMTTAPAERSRMFGVAGAGFEPATFGL